MRGIGNILFKTIYRCSIQLTPPIVSSLMQRPNFISIVTRPLLVDLSNRGGNDCARNCWVFSNDSLSSLRFGAMRIAAV
jgi:hypothetical protein